MVGCLVAPARGQVLRGQVVDTLTGRPVGAGFVVLLDGTGAEVLRLLSGPDGHFSLRAPGSGSYRLRSERIGYRAAELPSFELARGQTLDLVLKISPLPIRLADIEARSEGTCRIDPEEGEDAFILWEEIRKALTATVWSTRQQTFTYRKYNYDRDLDRGRQRVLREVGRTTVGRSSAPFRSRTASQLANEGYVIANETETWYYLPDAGVLLENEFVDTHCFRVVRNEREQPGQVGLAFTPVPGRDVPDIEGVLWLDDSSAELGALEVSYTDLPDGVEDDRIGGQVEFARLPSGAWIVSRWEIRTPIVEIEEQRGRFVRRRRRIAYVQGFHDIGGEILSVTGQDGSNLYAASLAHLVGTVFDSTRVGPLVDASVSVAGTNITTVTDSVGAYHLAAPLDGEYQVTVSHPWLDSVGIVDPAAIALFTRGSETSLAFDLPHINTLLRHLCRGDRMDAGSRVLVGRVRRSEAAPVPGATVRASWQIVKTDPARFVVEERERTAVADETGRYVLCGLPAARAIEVRADDGQLTSRTANVLFPAATEGTLSFAWDKTPGYAYTEAYAILHPIWTVDLTLVSGLEDQSDRLVVRGFAGVVTDSVSGEPIAQVLVSVNGEQMAVTAADGTFDIAVDVPGADPDMITFRRIGYVEVTREVRVGGDRPTVFLPVSLPPLPVELAEIVVEGERVLVSAKLKNTGFYERRERGRGRFLTEEDLDRFAPRVVTDVVQRVSGINYFPPSRGNVGLVGYIEFSRASLPCKMGRSPPTVYVDGFLLIDAFYNNVNDLLTLDVSNVAAMEFYNGASEVPPEFNRMGSACGVIVIWTK